MSRFQVIDLLPGYLEGELSGAERRQVEEAIAGDPTLAQEVASLRRALGELRGVMSMPETAPPGALPAAPPGAAVADQPRTIAGRAGAMSAQPSFAWRSALRLAAVVVLAFGAGFIARGLGSSTIPAVTSEGSGAPGGVADVPLLNDATMQVAAATYSNLPSESGLARSLIAASRAMRQAEQTAGRP